MDRLFLTILNMSLTGAFVIAAVCIARLSLKKAPKIISYCLWSVAWFRLVFPFSIESVFSLIPFKAQPIPQNIAMQATPRIDSGITIIDNAVSASLPAATPAASINPLQIWTGIGADIWLIGVVTMFLYGMLSYILLKRKMRTSIRAGENIYESDTVRSPFVLGIIKPKIYIPLGLSGGEREYILLHEQTHIRRHDHIVKFATYFILCLYWFNPLVWVAFLLMGVDMEMSCDERVLKEMGYETRKDYSLSLLSLASNQRVIGGSPLAFSEGGLKQRIKNVLNFKKPSRVIIVAAVVFSIVFSIGFAIDRIRDAENSEEWEVYDFPNFLYDRVIFQTDRESYNPEYISINAQLVNAEMDDGITCGHKFTVVKQIADEWRIIPFEDGHGYFLLTEIFLERGGSFTYTLTPKMLSVSLDNGRYRIITEISVGIMERTVWAEFTIDKNAPIQAACTFTT